MSVSEQPMKKRLRVPENLEHLATPGDCLQFHHVQLYAHKLRPLAEYKKMEDAMNKLTHKQEDSGAFFPDEKSKAELGEYWNTLVPDLADAKGAGYTSAQQDIVEQLIIGAGCRVIGFREADGLRAVLVGSKSPVSAKYVVTAPVETAEVAVPATSDARGCWNFSRAAQSQFFKSHNGRQGVGIMAFQITQGATVEQVYQNYKAKHPNLLVSEGPVVHIEEGDSVFKTLEVYAFYQAGSKVDADTGTVLQFVEKRGPKCESVVLPFFESCDATFESISLSCFPDHWVSNVVDREQYLSTLNDVLGFEPKVNFNAGVVAAGEAIIESTVTGNTPTTRLDDAQALLENQQQIYLPINNSLSQFGHVHFFIQEVGQGVQHVANRCSDLVHFIQRANDLRQITGRGFAFLRIPRSYYGYLKIPALAKASGLSDEKANELFTALTTEGVCDMHGVVKLDVDSAKVEKACKSVNCEAVAAVVAVVEEARFDHMTALLGRRLSKTELLRIVQNQILIDIQGNDILYQIFTRCILQDRPNDEAPFLEFIQRVCDTSVHAGDVEEKASEQVSGGGGGAVRKAKVKPGCGGFGIRNFLTLFLSIEVAKALRMREAGVAEGNALKKEVGDKMVAILTEQLNVSNPILTGISDAMTLEDELLQELENAPTDERKAQIEAEIATQRGLKEAGNLQLMKVSERFKNLQQQTRATYEATLTAQTQTTAQSAE